MAARGRSAVRTKNRVQPPIFVWSLIENTALMSHENRLAVPIFRRTHLHHGLMGLRPTQRDENPWVFGRAVRSGAGQPAPIPAMTSRGRQP